MASSSSSGLIIFCFFLVYISCRPVTRAQVDEASLQLITDTLDWSSAMSLYDELDDEDGVTEDETVRRSLFWQAVHYYISYGALSANRIPCPPRSGRSYYTHNCYRATVPANPYTRGCSKITRCRR